MLIFCVGLYETLTSVELFKRRAPAKGGGYSTGPFIVKFCYSPGVVIRQWAAIWYFTVPFMSTMKCRQNWENTVINFTHSEKRQETLVI